jgi:hypothetical protein
MHKYFFSFILAVIVFLTSICDAQTPQYDLPFRGDTAAIVNGKVIGKKEYIERFSDITMQMTKGRSTPLTPDEITDVQKQTWDELITNAIIDDSLEKKGITVSDQEVMTRLEKDPPEFLKRNFTDSTGKFRRSDYLSALKDPRNAASLKRMIAIMKPGIRRQKLSDVLMASLTVTDQELWRDYTKKGGSSQKKFDSEKETLRSEKLMVKQQTFFMEWMASAKKHAKIIDYRTVK